MYDGYEKVCFLLYKEETGEIVCSALDLMRPAEIAMYANGEKDMFGLNIPTNKFPANVRMSIITGEENLKECKSTQDVHENYTVRTKGTPLKTSKVLARGVPLDTINSVELILRKS